MAKQTQPVATATKQAANETKPAETAAPAAKKEPVYESEKLTALQSKKSETMKAAVVETDATKQEDLMLEVYKINQEISREIAEIKKHEAELELKAKRDAKVALFDNAVAAKLESDRVSQDDKMSIEEKNVVYDNAKKLREEVINLLLGTVKHTATATGKKASSGTRGATTQSIRELITPMFAAGQDGASIRASIIKDHGYNDGTANAVILAYEKEIGLK